MMDRVAMIPMASNFTQGTSLSSLEGLSALCDQLTNLEGHCRNIPHVFLLRKLHPVNFSRFVCFIDSTLNANSEDEFREATVT